MVFFGNLNRHEVGVRRSRKLFKGLTDRPEKSADKREQLSGTTSDSPDKFLRNVSRIVRQDFPYLSSTIPTYLTKLTKFLYVYRSRLFREFGKFSNNTNRFLNTQKSPNTAELYTRARDVSQLVCTGHDTQGWCVTLACLQAVSEGTLRCLEGTREVAEATIERWLGRQLKNHGCLYFKFVSPGNAGVPDRILISPDGRIIFVELKTTIGKPSPMQIFQITRLRQAGCDVRIIYGMAQAHEFIQEIKGGDA